tara:strand:- start:1887 stop:2261 length:375 start_codon:yes stop_codon:yes gene_type:complete
VSVDTFVNYWSILLTAIACFGILALVYDKFKMVVAITILFILVAYAPRQLSFNYAPATPVGALSLCPQGHVCKSLQERSEVSLFEKDLLLERYTNNWFAVSHEVRMSVPTPYEFQVGILFIESL